MYIVPPHSSKPYWMPQTSLNASCDTMAHDSSMNATMASANRASKQRMDSVKRKRYADDTTDDSDDGLPYNAERFAQSRNHADETKRARVMPSVSFVEDATNCKASLSSSSSALHSPAPMSMMEMDEASDGSTTPFSDDSAFVMHSSMSSSSTFGGSASNDGLHASNSYFPDQCLRLSVGTPTGHPHPYANPLVAHDSTAASCIRGRSELGASYFQ